MKRRIVALVILHGLIMNPKRYDYIEHLAKTGEYTNEELTAKNINKAFKMADQFLGWKK